MLGSIVASPGFSEHFTIVLPFVSCIERRERPLNSVVVSWHSKKALEGSRVIGKPRLLDLHITMAKAKEPEPERVLLPGKPDYDQCDNKGK